MKKEDELLIELINKIENSNDRWQKPWTSLLCDQSNFITNKPYTGVNIIILTSQQLDKGYTLPMWAGFNQIKSNGMNVRKGEKGTMGLRVNTIRREDSEGNESIIKVPASFTVFNIDQCDGADEIKASLAVRPTRSCDEVDAIIEKTGAHITHGGDKACYYPSLDMISMPTKESFLSDEGYYATLFHELTHWTKHESRLNRNFEYAIEECIAELGAVMCMNKANMESDISNHAAYLSSWIGVVKEKPRLLMSIISKSSDAVKMIFGESDNNIDGVE